MTCFRSRIALAATQPDHPPLRGPFLTIPSPIVAEIACASQPDFICVDMEHGPMPAETGENMIRAAALFQVPALVRVPGVEPVAIGQALDWGAAGVLVPRVNTAADARRVVEASRFAPEGRRGAGPGRAMGYGRNMAAGIEVAAKSTVVALQIETVEALDHLDDILAVPGVDLIFIGPGDLGLGLSALGRGHELPAIVERILVVCAAAKVPAGIFTMTAQALRAYAGRIALGIVGSDTTVLIAGFDENFAPILRGQNR